MSVTHLSGVYNTLTARRMYNYVESYAPQKHMELDYNYTVLIIIGQPYLLVKALFTG